MGRKEKLIKELKKRPKTFAFADAESLLNYLDFVRSDKGRTSGSRIMFVSKLMIPSYYINRIYKKI